VRDESTTMERLHAELLDAAAQVAARIDPEGAVLFLDRLARCEASGEIDVADAVALREREAERLARAAAEAIDPEELVTRGWILAAGEAAPGEAERWIGELVHAAIVAPWVADPVRARMFEVTDEATLMIEANPGPFLAAAASLVEDVRRFGRAERLACADLLRVCERLPKIAAIDDGAEAQGMAVQEAGAAYEPSADARAWLDDVLRSAPRELLEGADAALRDAGQWADKVTSLRRATRHLAGGAAPLRLAAKGAGELGEHVLLRRVPEGELLLSRDADRLYLDWYPSAHAESMEARARLDDDRALASAPLEGGVRWALPDRPDPLPIEVEVDGLRLKVVLPA